MTFTRAAADELRGRVTEALGDLPALPRLGTFHSLALRLLRRHGEAIGLASDVDLCDEGRRQALLRDLKLFWTGADGLTLADAISHWKNHGIPPQEAAATSVGEMKKAAEGYGLYEQGLAARGWLDFDDLLLRLTAALEADEALRRAVSGQILHLLVDEVQDVNPVQVRLTEMLSHAHANLWMVGDDDQSIYGFRAADLDFILAFEAQHPDAQVHRLTETYRAGEALVQVTQSLIANNQRRHDKPLIACGRPGRLIANRLDSDTEEAQWIAGAIRSALDKGYDPAGIAVLTRTRALAEMIQPALLAQQVPLVLRQVRGLWDISPLRPLLEALRLAAAGKASPEQLRALGTGKQGQALAVAVRDVQGKRWGQQVSDLIWAARKTSPGKWSSDGTVIHALLDEVKAMAFDQRRPAGPEGFFAAVETQKTLLAAAGTGPAVTLSTIHSAKGLEWDMVFIPGLEANRMPLANEDEEEERRIAYVGLTRARRLLTLSCVRTRGRDAASPSPFWAEMDLPAIKDALSWRGSDEPLSALLGAAMTASVGKASRAATTATGGRVAARSGPVQAPPRATPLPSGIEPPPPFAWTAKGVDRYAKNIADGKAPRANIGWSAEEDSWLAYQVEARRDLDLIAQALERSASAVAGHLEKLDLIEEGGRETLYRVWACPPADSDPPAAVPRVSTALPDPHGLPETNPERRAQNIARGQRQRSGEPWSTAEDSYLRDRLAERWPLADIANRLDRSPQAVATRMVQAALLVDRHPQAAYARACAAKSSSAPPAAPVKAPAAVVPTEPPQPPWTEKQQARIQENMAVGNAPRSFLPWQAEEDAWLCHRVGQRVPLETLVTELERGPLVIANRLEGLGLLPASSDPASAYEAWRQTAAE